MENTSQMMGLMSWLIVRRGVKTDVAMSQMAEFKHLYLSALNKKYIPD